MSNILVIISNCKYSIIELVTGLISDPFLIFVIFILFLAVFATIYGVVYSICCVKKIKKWAIISFFTGIAPVVICLVVLFIVTIYNSIEWSKKRLDLEKANEVLFNLYDENIEITKNKYIAVELTEDCIKFKLYNYIYDGIFNEYLAERDFAGKIEININEEEKDLLKKAMQYDEVIIVDGNEVVYKKRLKNKNPIYCDKMYKIKYNRAQEYQDEHDRSFMEHDRKWCVEDPYVGEGGRVPWFSWGLNIDKYGIYK